MRPWKTPGRGETPLPQVGIGARPRLVGLRRSLARDDHIQDGDIIIVEKRETAENGESVVAMINGERVTLKRFYVEADGIRLQPANPAMEPIYLRHEELQILGIVSGVIRT